MFQQFVNNLLCLLVIGQGGSSHMGYTLVIGQGESSHMSYILVIGLGGSSHVGYILVIGQGGSSHMGYILVIGQGGSSDPHGLHTGMHCKFSITYILTNRIDLVSNVL